MSTNPTTTLSSSGIRDLLRDIQNNQGEIDLFEILFAISPDIPGLPLAMEVLPDLFGTLSLPLPGALMDLIGEEIRIQGETELPFFGAVELELRIQDQLSFPALRLTGSLPNDEAWSFPGVNWFALSDVGLGLMVGIDGVDLLMSGELKLGNLPLPVAILPPSGNAGWRLRLLKAGSINLPNLPDVLKSLDMQDAAKLLPADLDVGGNLIFNEFEVGFSFQRKTLDYLKLGIGLEKDWKMGSDFYLRDSELQFQVEDPLVKSSRQIQGFLKTNLDLDGNNLPVLLEFPTNSDPFSMGLDALEGINLPDLGDLLSLGREGATNILPAGIASLRGVKLHDFDVQLSGATKKLSYIGFSAEMTQSWNLPGLEEFVVKNLQLDLSIDQPRLKQHRKVEGMLRGNLSLFDQEVELIGILGEETVLTALLPDFSFATLVDELLPDVPFPSDLRSLKLQNLSFHFSPSSGAFGFEGNVRMNIPLLSKKFRVDGLLSIEISKDALGKRVFEGSFRSTFEIDKDNLLHLGFEIDPDDRIIFGAWERKDGKAFSFGDVVKEIGLEVDIIPDTLDPSIQKVGLAFDSKDFNFTLMASSPDLGEIFCMYTKKRGGKKGMIFGLELPPNQKLSDIPGIGDEFKDLDGMTFERLSLLFSSAPLSDVQLPDLSDVLGESPVDSTTSTPAPAASSSSGNSSATNRTPASPASTGAQALTATEIPLILKQGANVIAQVNFDKNNDPMLNRVKESTGLDDIIFQTSVGRDGLVLRAALPGSLKFQVGGDELEFKRAAIELMLGAALGVKFYGSLGFEINNQLLEATGGMVLTIHEASAFMMVQPPENAPPGKEFPNLLEPLGIKNVSLSEVGLIVGATFIPPGIKSGFHAAFALGDQAPGSNSMTIILRIIPAVPSPVVNVDLLDFHAEEMSLDLIMRTFTDVKPPKALKDLGVMDTKASNLGFYYCAAITTLPDGSMAYPGFGFNGDVDLFGFKALAKLKIDPFTGIEGHFQLNPIQLKVGDLTIISITGKSEQVIQKQWRRVGDTEWKRLDNQKGLLPNPEKEEEVVIIEERDYVRVEAGGPVFQFSTSGPKFLYASLEISLFNVLRHTVQAEATTGGFFFNMKTELSDILEISLSCNINTGARPDLPKGFTARASFFLDLDFEVDMPSIGELDLGTFRLDAELSAELYLEISDQRFLLSIDGNFEFEGIEFDLPKIELHVPIASFQEIPEKIIEKIKEEAEDLFSDLWKGLEEIWEDAEQFVEDVAKEVEEGVKLIAEEAEELGKEAIKKAEEAIEIAEDTIDKIEEGAEKALEEATEVAEKAVEEVAELVEEAEEKVEEFAQEALEFAEETGEEIVKLAEETEKFVKNVEKEISKTVNAAAKEVEKLGKAAIKEAGKILEDAEKFAKDVVNAAEKFAAPLLKEARKLEKLAEQIWAEITAGLSKVGKGIESGGKTVAKGAKKVWKEFTGLF